MNKTVNINLAGIFFHIDEDAYLKLSRYLEAIKRSFTDSQGRSEIISDIEARIAELFSERIQNDKQVVGIKLVDDVIAIMGQPEDYLVDDEIFEDGPQPQQSTSTNYGPTKKLYRDTDNSYIGGVSSGLSHYLGIDMIWVRLLWVLFTFLSGGSFIIIYLIFWALVPEAKTTAEKLIMTGEPVNISNIEKKIKDGIDTVSQKVKNVDLKKHGESIKEGFENVADNVSEAVQRVDFEKQGSRLKKTSRNFFETVGDILMFFLKIFAKFFGIILIITGISVLLSLIVAFFTVGITDIVHFPGMDVIDAANAANAPIWLMSLLVFLAVGIPFFFIFYIGLKILVNNLKSIGNVAKFTLLGLWIVAVIGLAIISIKQASEHAFSATVKHQESISITAKDTLRLTMNKDNDNYRNSLSFVSRDSNGRTLNIKDVRLIVRSTKDTTARIETVKNAYGSRYNVAKERAQNINYNYAFANNTLTLDTYLSTDIDNKFSEQEIEVILYLPEGTTLYADNNTYRYHRNSSYYRDILKNGMEEKYLTIIEDDIICNHCDDNDNTLDININGESSKIEFSEEDGIVVKSGDSVKLEINDKGIKANGKDINVNINEKDGVNIEVKDN